MTPARAASTHGTAATAYRRRTACACVCGHGGCRCHRCHWRLCDLCMLSRCDLRSRRCDSQRQWQRRRRVLRTIGVRAHHHPPTHTPRDGTEGCRRRRPWEGREARCGGSGARPAHVCACAAATTVDGARAASNRFGTAAAARIVVAQCRSRRRRRRRHSRHSNTAAATAAVRHARAYVDTAAAAAAATAALGASLCPVRVMTCARDGVDSRCAAAAAEESAAG